MKSKLRWSTGGPGSDFIDVLLNSYEKAEKSPTTLEHWLAAGQAQIPLSFYGILMNNLPLWSPARPGLASQGFTKHPLEQKRRKFVLPDLHQNKNEEGLLYQANSKAKMNKNCFNTHSWSRNKEELLYQAFSKSKVKKTWFTTPPRNQKWRRIALTSRLQSKSEVFCLRSFLYRKKEGLFYLIPLQKKEKQVCFTRPPPKQKRRRIVLPSFL